jgi:mRNA-degrading endonuclease RelE of RelBE toxin-antitoxin system
LWNDRLRIAERVRNDWTRLSAKDRKTAENALEKIDQDPIVGAPLFHPLRGYWSYHHGDLRVVYRIVSEARMILILKIARAVEQKP